MNANNLSLAKTDNLDQESGQAIAGAWTAVEGPDCGSAPVTSPSSPNLSWVNSASNPGIYTSIIRSDTDYPDRTDRTNQIRPKPMSRKPYP